jgi:phosphatidylinositol glycan class W
LCAALAHGVASTLAGVSPLLILGGARLVVHEIVNYQRHDSEYGVHWNFFFTSAAVALLAACLEAVWRVAEYAACAACGAGCRARDRTRRDRWQSPTATAAAYLALGAAVAAGYQAALRAPWPGAASLEDFILRAPRSSASFFAQNREGLAGTLGFFAIYLCGVAAGRVLLDPARTAPAQWRALLASGAAAVAAAAAALAAAVHAFGPVSRRLVSTPYIIWVLVFNGAMLLGMLAIDAVTVVYDDDGSGGGGGESGGRERGAVAPAPAGAPAAVCQAGSVIVDAISANFLAIFVIANLLVGLPNHTMRTIDASDGVAMAILSAYMLAVCTIAVALRAAGLQLKVW